MGLDRDSTRWNLPDKVVQRRRVLFWDLFVADAWHVGKGPQGLIRVLLTSCLYLKSLDTGRPPGFTRAYIDCRFPGSENANEKGDTDLNAECRWLCASFAIH